MSTEQRFSEISGRWKVDERKQTLMSEQIQEKWVRVGVMLPGKGATDRFQSCVWEKGVETKVVC